MTSVNIFRPEPSEELSFFIGAWLGDGWGDESDGGKRMLLKVRSFDFAKQFAGCATKILGKTNTYWVRRVVDKGGRWYLVKVTSFMLYEFVNQSMEKLLAYVKQSPMGFLRGFFTAEGNPSISIQRSHGGYLAVGLVVSNNDYALLDFARTLLLNTGFHPSGIRLNVAKGTRTNIGVANADGWLLSLSRITDAREFARKICFADSEKQTKLLEAISFVDTYGRRGAADVWLKHYEKMGKKWMKKKE
jgi:intein-encoded DNA endonuclease-like protein